MTDKPCPSNIKAAISRFEQAAQDYAFKGSAHPDDWDYIERKYERTRANLEAVIAKAVWRG